MKSNINFENIHPNPTFCRKNWTSLCGAWNIEFLEGKGFSLDKKQIIVPFSYETKASGIGKENIATKVVYTRTFEVKAHEGSVLLHFGAVDYRCEVWINGIYAGGHIGCYTAFCLDITQLVKLGDNDIKVIVYDSLNKAQLRGKQRAREESYECWYVQTTGIWKDVWLEYAGKNYIEDLTITTDGESKVSFNIHTIPTVKKVDISISFEGESILTTTAAVDSCKGEITVTIPSPHLWEVGTPNLYDVTFTTEDDEVHSYFGIRRISTKEGKVLINNNPTYLKMVLEQGYWQESGLTAPSVKSLYEEVELIKALGFNGVRMHQKVESALFYYFCDLIGLYVWGEIPSNYEYSDEAKAEMLRDCPLIVKQLSPYPSVIAWVIFNESWGIPHIKNDRDSQLYVEKVCAKVREIDSTRLIVSNDGWHQLDGDLLSLHEYEQNPQTILSSYGDREKLITGQVYINNFGYPYAEGYSYKGQPIILSEFGGIAIDESEGWGYGEKADNKEEYAKRLSAMFEVIGKLDYLAGYCYTQITDVQQEVNGLCYVDRTPKIPIEKIRSAIEGR